MLSEVTALEVLARVKKTHTPVSATSVPSVTNTLAFLPRPAGWVMEVVEGEAAAEALGAGVGVAPVAVRQETGVHEVKQSMKEQTPESQSLVSRLVV